MSAPIFNLSATVFRLARPVGELLVFIIIFTQSHKPELQSMSDNETKLAGHETYAPQSPLGWGLISHFYNPQHDTS